MEPAWGRKQSAAEEASIHARYSNRAPLLGVPQVYKPLSQGVTAERITGIKFNPACEKVPDLESVSKAEKTLKKMELIHCSPIRTPISRNAVITCSELNPIVSRRQKIIQEKKKRVSEKSPSGRNVAESSHRLWNPH